MSRVGKLPIKLPQGVSLSVKPDNTVTVKGPKGELYQAVDPDIKVEINGDEIVVVRPTEQKRHKALAWSLPRTDQQYGEWCIHRIYNSA